MPVQKARSTRRMTRSLIAGRTSLAYPLDVLQGRNRSLHITDTAKPAPAKRSRGRPATRIIKLPTNSPEEAARTFFAGAKRPDPSLRIPRRKRSAKSTDRGPLASFRYNRQNSYNALYSMNKSLHSPRKCGNCMIGHQIERDDIRNVYEPDSKLGQR